MAQHDMNIADAPGVTFLADLNDALAAIVSQNSGATEPATTFAYMWWADTTTGKLKQRDAANSAWVVIGDLASAGFGITGLSPEVPVHAASSKATPVDADETLLVDSAASNGLKKLTWSSIKAALKTYFDTLYQPVGGGGGFATGMVMSFDGATAPSGWILSDGRTIGDGSSGATNRANADCQALFTQYWNDYTNTECPVSGGRGASAAADWAAHKTLTVPDRRGRGDVGKDNMGGTAANRITSGGSGITGTTLGASGGSQTVTLTTNEMPVHSHTIPTNAGGGGDGFNGAGLGAGTWNTGNAGSGAAHQNTQPSIVSNKIIKL